MYKLVIGALLLATTTLAQTKTQPRPNQTGMDERPSGSAESTTQSKSKKTATTARPLPQPSLKEKLQSNNTNLPTYKKSKDAGVQKVKPKYSPRRTASGQRKDTLNSRVP